MKCQEVVQSLPAFQDGDLPADQQATLQAHLDQCEACVAELAAMDQAWAMLDLYPTVEVAQDFNHRFWQRVENEPVGWWQRVRTAVSRVVRMPVRAMAVVAVMMVLVGGFFTYVPGTVKPQETAVVVPSPAQDDAQYNVLGDVAEMTPELDDDAGAVVTAPTTDAKVDQILQEMPLGPQS